MASEEHLLSTSLTAGSQPFIVSGEGVWLTLDDGRKVIDATNTAAPLGHSHPEIVEAVRKAAYAPALNEGMRWGPRESAADALLETYFDGEDWAGAVRFFVSAGEANDVIGALCQALTGRTPLATRERAYHGGVGYARELTVQPQWHGGVSYRDHIEASPRMAEIIEMPAPIGARIAGPKPDREGDLAAINAAAPRLSGAAALFLDYSQGGIYHQPWYQDRMAELAREAGAVWIADETVSGFGRMGYRFQFQAGDSRPDIVTMGKGLAAGGSPGGAAVLSKELVERLGNGIWQSYSSYRAHPIQVAATEAHVRVSQRERLWERAASFDDLMAAGMTEIANRHPGIARIDGRALHWTIELHGPDWREWEGRDPNPLASRIAARIQDAGVLIATSGEQTSLFVAPPLIVEEAELKQILEAVDHGLDLADEELERNAS